VNERSRKLTRFEWINKRRKVDLKIKIEENGLNLEPKTDFEREFLNHYFSDGIKADFDNKRKVLIIRKLNKKLSIEENLPF